MMVITMKFCMCFFFLMIRRPPRSTQSRSSAASDVYNRQLNNLVQEDKLRRINTFDNVSHYDYVLDDHIHFVCEKCNKIVDLENTNDLKDALEEMDVSHNNLLIYGICSDCKGG